MVSEIYLLLAGALVFSLLTLVLQYTVGNRRRVQAIQKEMNEVQKEFQKAATEKDEKKLKEMEEKQKHMMHLMMESMSLQFKPTLIVLPVFLLLFGGFGFSGFLSSGFPNFSVSLPVALHLTSNELLGLNIFHSSAYGPRGFFIVAMIFIGLLLQVVGVPVYEKFFARHNG